MLLDEARVAIVPGEAFGAPGYARLSYALADDDLVEGVARIAKALGAVVARVLVTEELAERGLAALRAAGHDVDIQLGSDARTSCWTPVKGAGALDHPQRHQGHRRGSRRGHRSRRGWPGRHRTRQRRRRGRDPPRRDGRQCAAVEHPVGGRAHDGVAAGRGAQHAAGPRRAQGRDSGKVEVGRRRAARQDAWRLLGSGTSGPSWPSARTRSACGWSPATSGCRPTGPAVSASSLVETRRVVAESDFITVHLQKTPETVGLIGEELLAKAKPGIRIINTARGGIVDEAALAEAIAAGRDGRRRTRRLRRGADDRVAVVRPRPSVVVTPHLAVAPSEAQDKAGVTIAEQVTAGARPESSLPSPSTSRPSKRRRPCDRSLPWPSGSG